MPMIDEPISLTGIIVGVIGLISAGISWVVNRRPQQADYAAKLLDSTVPAYESLARRLTAVELQHRRCEERNNLLEEQCEAMIEYLHSVGLDVPTTIPLHGRDRPYNTERPIRDEG